MYPISLACCIVVKLSIRRQLPGLMRNHHEREVGVAGGVVRGDGESMKVSVGDLRDESQIVFEADDLGDRGTVFARVNQKLADMAKTLKEFE